MTLNATGPISLAGSIVGQSTEIELNGNGTTKISLGDSSVRSLLGVPSGPISLGSARGKSYLITVNYLVVGGGAGGSTCTGGIVTNYDKYNNPSYVNSTFGYMGNGGGGGRINSGTMILTPHGSSYGLTVGGGGGGDVAGGGGGGDGGASSFNGQNAAGGLGSTSIQQYHNGGSTFSSFQLPGMYYTAEESGAWSRFQDSNSVWNGGYSYDVTQNIYFPTTGTYVLYGSADDFGQVIIDGTLYQLGGFNGYSGVRFSLTAGYHSVRVYADNRGGYQAGISFTLMSEGQYFSTTGNSIAYGADGFDGYNSGSGTWGAAGTGQGGNGTQGYYYDGRSAGNGGSGCIAIQYPGSAALFNGGTVTISGGYVNHTFTNPGTYTFSSIT